MVPNLGDSRKLKNNMTNPAAQAVKRRPHPLQTCHSSPVEGLSESLGVSGTVDSRRGLVGLESSLPRPTPRKGMVFVFAEKRQINGQ